MIGSIVQSKLTLETDDPVIGKIVFPDMAKIRDMSVGQMCNLSIAKVRWCEFNEITSLGFTLSNG